MRKPRTRLADEQGTTFAELMVVCTLMLIVLGMIFLVFGAARAVADSAEARAEAADESRVAMDRLTRELRQAQENVEGMGAVSIAEPRRCQLYIDLTHDGRPERVTFYVANGSLYRTQANPTNNLPPFTFGGESAPKLLVKKLKADWTAAMFKYYTNANPPVVTAALPNISAVQIEVVNQASSGRKTVFVDADTWVKIRSVQNTVN